MDNPKKMRDRDIISEQEYNRRIALSPTSLSASPERDSPGDSEEDAGSEFDVGLNYIPEETEEDEIFVDDSEAFTVTEIEPKIVPEGARVIASEQPSPWADLDTPSDTH